MSLQVGIFRSEKIGIDEELQLPIFDRAVTEEFLEKLFFMVYGDGVFPSPSTAFQLRAGTGLTATLQPGALFCHGKFAYDEKSTSVNFTQNNGDQDLIARLVFRRDLPNRMGSFVVLYGTPSAEPQAPALTRTADIYELGIADVLLKHGAESITDADITDLRMNSEFCGIITGSIEITDTTEIFAQFTSIFQGLFNQMEEKVSDLESVISGIEQGSEVMLRAVYDTDGDGVVNGATFLYKCTPKVDGWSGSDEAGWTQTVPLEPTDEGPETTDTAQLSPPMYLPTGVQTTDETLSGVCGIINKGVSTPGAGNVTLKVWSKPTADADIYYYGKAGEQA